jgi:hypothetical protein
MKGDAKSHYVALEPAHVSARAAERWKWDDMGGGPFVTFIFNYWSLEALHALHIVPRTP